MSWSFLEGLEAIKRSRLSLVDFGQFVFLGHVAWLVQQASFEFRTLLSLSRVYLLGSILGFSCNLYFDYWDLCLEGGVSTSKNGDHNDDCSWLSNGCQCACLNFSRWMGSWELISTFIRQCHVCRGHWSRSGTYTPLLSCQFSQNLFSPSHNRVCPSPERNHSLEVIK